MRTGGAPVSQVSLRPFNQIPSELNLPQATSSHVIDAWVRNAHAPCIELGRFVVEEHLLPQVGFFRGACCLFLQKLKSVGLWNCHLERGRIGCRGLPVWRRASLAECQAGPGDGEVAARLSLKLNRAVPCGASVCLSGPPHGGCGYREAPRTPSPEEHFQPDLSRSPLFPCSDELRRGEGCGLVRQVSSFGVRMSLGALCLQSAKERRPGWALGGAKAGLCGLFE